MPRPDGQGRYIREDTNTNLLGDLGGDNQRGGPSFFTGGNNAPGGYSDVLGQATSVMPQGFQNLMEILQSQGATSPLRMNRQLTANARNTEAQQQQQMGRAAGRGMQNAGVTNAITAAIGAAGADRAGGIRANEAAMQEQRKRQDLESLFKLMGLMGESERTTMWADEAARKRADAKKAGLLQLLQSGLGSASDWADRMEENRDQRWQGIPDNADSNYSADEDPSSFWYTGREGY